MTTRLFVGSSATAPEVLMDGRWDRWGNRMLLGVLIPNPGSPDPKDTGTAR